MDQHVTDVVCSCSYYIRALWHIRPCLTMDAAKMISQGLVTTRLDYGNGLLLGKMARNLDRLQVAQKSERSHESCMSGSTFLQCNWSTLLPSLAADTTENWLKDCHDYVQSQTNQHTSLHGIIDQWLHHITNFTIIWQITVVPTCHYSDICSRGFSFIYHLEQTSVILSICYNF